VEINIDALTILKLNNKFGMDIEYHCRVCGLKQQCPPWEASGKEPSYEICDCCGVEFGYEDSSLKGVITYRENWLAQGVKWFRPSEKPHDWSLEKQMTQIPADYRYA
jgi:hypothetical protein